MDFFDSKAAVDAMAALQARIKELELKNERTKKEIERLQQTKARDESILLQRESSLMEAANKADEMLASASENLIELRRIKRENRQLSKRLEEIQSNLNNKLDQEDQVQANLNRYQKKCKNAEKLLSEYEDLFCEVLAPPDFDGDISGYIPFNNTTSSVITHSLPANLQTTVRLLQSLPFPFRDQKIDKKREILTVLTSARNIACKLAEEIHLLTVQGIESHNSRRTQDEIETKSAQLGVLIQAMHRFRFN